MMITSLKNDKVRYVRALQTRRRVRQRERRLVFEGIRLVEEALVAGLAPDFAFYTEQATANGRGEKVVEELRQMQVACHEVSEAVLRACSDTEAPQPILVVLPIPDLPRPHHPTFTLLVDGVRDPGNLGTLLRTALAAGVEQVILAPGTVDTSNPKVIRAAMGAHLHLPLVALRWDRIEPAVSGASVWLAAADGEVPYTEVDWTLPLALIVGGEGSGAGPQAQALAAGRVSIPMAAGVESLNTGVAAAVVLFEIRRQREPRPC